MEKKMEKEETVDIYNPVTDTTYRIRKKQTTKNTTEEWENRITWDDGEYFMIDGKDAGVKELNTFIKQLLEEKEKEIFTTDELKTILKCLPNAGSTKGLKTYQSIKNKIKRLLSKLNK